MKHKVTLTITSLLSIIFAAFHLTDDIVRGMEPGGVVLALPLAITLRYGVVAREEAYLERRFGDAYRDYKARVRRWL